MRYGRTSLKKQSKEIKSRKFLIYYTTGQDFIAVTLTDEKGFTTGKDVVKQRLFRNESNDFLFQYLEKIIRKQDTIRSRTKDS